MQVKARDGQYWVIVFNKQRLMRSRGNCTESFILWMGNYCQELRELPKVTHLICSSTGFRIWPAGLPGHVLSHVDCES